MGYKSIYIYINDIREESYDDDIAHGCIELDINKLPTLDFKELEKMYYNDEDGFIKAYRLDSFS